MGISDHTVYDLLKKNNIETVIVDYWKRVPKEAFYNWHNSQSKYRTKEDREKDVAIENTELLMKALSNSEMAALMILLAKMMK